MLIVEDELEWLEVFDEELDEELDLLVEVEVVDWLEPDGDMLKTVTVLVTVVVDGEHVEVTSGLGTAATARKRVAKVRIDWESMFAN